MANYLRNRDLQLMIQDQNQLQISNLDPGIVALIENVAEEEFQQTLQKKFDTTDEFQPTLPLDLSAPYAAAARAEMSFPPFSASATYSVGDLVSFGLGPVVAPATAAVLADEWVAVAPNGPGAWDPADWLLLGQQYDLWNVAFPYPRFDYLSSYQEGSSRVYWQGSVYQCSLTTSPPDHYEVLQSRTYSRVPYPNAFPGASFLNGTNVNQSFQQWGRGTPYQVPAGYFPGFSTVAAWSSLTSYGADAVVSYANALYPSLTTWYAVQANTGQVPGADIANWLPVGWQEGDNRSQQIVMRMTDVALHHLHARIAPRNVPELRVERYKEALEWLHAALHGEISPVNLFLNQPELGAAIAYGGNVKNWNTY